MRDMKYNDTVKMQGWKMRQTETVAQYCTGWKMHMPPLTVKRTLSTTLINFCVFFTIIILLPLSKKACSLIGLYYGRPMAQCTGSVMGYTFIRETLETNFLQCYAFVRRKIMTFQLTSTNYYY